MNTGAPQPVNHLVAALMHSDITHETVVDGKRMAISIALETGNLLIPFDVETGKLQPDIRVELDLEATASG